MSILETYTLLRMGRIKVSGVTIVGVLPGFQPIWLEKSEVDEVSFVPAAPKTNNKWTGNPY